MKHGIEVISTRGVETVYSATALSDIIRSLGNPTRYNFNADTDVLTLRIEGNDVSISSPDAAPGLHTIAAALSDIRGNTVVRFNEYAWQFDCAALPGSAWVPVPQG